MITGAAQSDRTFQEIEAWMREHEGEDISALLGLPPEELAKMAGNGEEEEGGGGEMAGGKADTTEEFDKFLANRARAADSWSRVDRTVSNV